MSLISKPFDDSGVDMVDDIARYGTSISKRIERLRQRNHLRSNTATPFSGLEVALALCETLRKIIDASSHEPYRTECARAADTIFLESVSPDFRPGQEPPLEVRLSPQLTQEISSILADEQILPGNRSVPLQTVLLALTWSALSFAMESLPAGSARAWVRNLIMSPAAPARYH